jgi:acetyl-CoA acetyltransferase
MFSNVYIPYRGYYTSPFSRYGKTFKNFNSIELSAKTTKTWLESISFNSTKIDFVIYGTSVHQHYGFWAGPWAASMIGSNTTGTMISQACTTGATSLYYAANNVENGMCKVNYSLTADRVSNGPIVSWPEYDKVENWVKDNFEYDPWGKTNMLQTAENVAKKFSITKEEIDDITAYRHTQYYNLKEKPYMFETATLLDDEGPRQISIERLKKLKPVQSDGIHSIGNLTYAADGHCGILVTDKNIALEFNKNIKIQIVSYGYSRCETSLMPYASVPATEMALKNANISIKDCKVVNQHNAFAVNDVAFAKALDIDPFKMNNYGSPLVYGHPQSPVLSRLTVEAIEELVNTGGGYALVTGAAGGDTGAALVLKVDG